MNRETEERIVAMYFDNKDFEENAQQTIETLGQLKESLNMEDSAKKGFAFFDKLGKTMKFENATTSLQRIKSRLNGMSGALGKVFKIGEAPLREAENLIGTIRGYLGKVVGFDFASMIVSSVERAFRGLTIQPIMAGWNQYESKMDSVKTIMSSTGESMDVVEEHLGKMTEYANKTIYSLTDMTSNLGKFTNVGIKLDRAEKAMEGIANATADAGQDSRAASMAMYNISQAMGVGKMTTIDWKSLENANIATSKLKNTFIELAAAQGKLEKKKGADGSFTYWITHDENGKKLKKAVEVNASNFRETLSKGWLDKETMLRTFELYSGVGIDENTLKSWGITDPEEIKRLMQLGEEAAKSATEVRTFSKMMDALKESVQSGWAESFQIIFGNMEEGTQLWTRMNEKLDGILSKSTERRNTILKGWAEMAEDGGSIWTVDEKNNKVRREGVLGGRDILIEAFFDLMDVVSEFGEAVSKTFSSVFGKIDAKKLFDLTIQFREFVAGIKAWLGSTSDSESRISKLMKGLTGIFNIVKVGIRVIKTAVNLLRRILSPVLDWAIDKFAEFGEFFNNAFGNMTFDDMIKKIGTGLKNAWESVKKFFTPQDIINEQGKVIGKQIPVIAWLQTGWAKLKEIVRQWAQENGLAGVYTTLSGWWDALKGAFEEGKSKVITAWDNIKNWFITSGVADFFSNTWNWIVDVTGKAWNFFTKPNESGKTEFAEWLESVGQFFKNLWDGPNGIATWGVWQSIGNFLGNTWSWIQSMFPVQKDYDDRGFEKNNGAPSVGGWLESIWLGIKNAWENIKKEGTPIFTEICNFLGNTWAWISAQFTSTTTYEDDRGFPHTAVTQEAPIITWLTGIWEGIRNAWEDIKKVGAPVFTEICGFLGRTWEWISSQFKPQVQHDDRGFELYEKKAPIVGWLEGIWKSVQDVWHSITDWEGWPEIGKFLGNTWEWITGLFTGGTGESSANVAAEDAAKTEKAAAKTVQPTVDAVGFFERILAAVGGFFESIKKAFSSITNIPEINTFINSLGDFFKGIFTFLGNLMGSTGRVLQGKGSTSDWTTIIGVSLPILLTKIAEFLNNKHLSEIDGAQSFATKFLELAGGLALMAGAVALLTTLDSGKMWEAVGVIGALGVIVSVILGLFTKFTKAQTAANINAPITSGERILTNLINVIGKIGIVAVALKMLPDVIRSLGEAKAAANGAEIGKDFLNIMLGLVTFIGGVSLTLGIVQKIAPQGLDPTATGKTLLSIVEFVGGLAVVMLAVGGIGEGLKGIFGEHSMNDILNALDTAAEFFEHLGGAVAGFFRGLFGIKTDAEKADEAVGIAQSLSKAAEGFGAEQVSGLTRMITLLTQLSDGSIKFDTAKMGNFGEAMSALGAGVYDILVYFSNAQDWLNELGKPGSDVSERFNTFIGIIKQMGEALSSFDPNLYTFQFGVSGLDKLVEAVAKFAADDVLPGFVENWRKIVSALGSIEDPNNGIQFDGLTIVGKLFSSIQKGLASPDLPAFDATPIVDAIVKAIGLGDTYIASKVHEFVQKGLDLSVSGENGGFDFTTNNGLASILTGGSGGSALSDFIKGLNVDSSNLFNQNQFSEQLFGTDGKGGILGDMNTFKDRMPSMASIFDANGWLNFEDESGQPIDILGVVQEHLNGVGNALNEMGPLKITITPVFDFDNMTPGAIQALLDEHPLPMRVSMNTGNMGVDLSALDSALDLGSIRSRLDNLIGTVAQYGYAAESGINALAGHIDGIANEVAAMKLYLDTGVLVGAITPKINAQLYKNALIFDR